MGASSTDNNPDVIKLIKLIGETPGFRLASAKSGNFKAARNTLAYGDHTVEEASKVISIRTKPSSFPALLKKLGDELGWTHELHEDIKQIERKHRIAGTDPTAQVTERLLSAFKPDWNTPVVPVEPETDEQRRERVRHDKFKTQQVSKGGQISTGVSSVPAQVLQGKEVIRAEFISPERALELLVTIADYQRKLKDDKVRDFMALMERPGEWMLMPSDPICVDWNGNLCNGQHRLEAVYRREVGQEFYVAYNVDPATYDKMDRGTRRTTADALYGKSRSEGTLRADVSASALASLLRVLYLWENSPQEEWASEQRLVKEPQVMEALKSHPAAEDSVAHGRLTKLRIKPTAAMFAHYLISYAHDFEPRSVAILNAWYEELRKPRVIRPGDPAFVLREWFMGGEMDRVANRKSLPTRYDELLLQTYLILRAWDNTCHGKAMLRLSWKPDFKITMAARITDKMTFAPEL